MAEMTVDQQLYDIRFAVNDFPDAVYSLYDKLNALNQVVFNMNTVLSNISSDLVKERVTLTLTSGSVDLPDDYGGMISLTDTSGVRLYERIGEDSSNRNTYELINNKIYAAYDSLTLTYKKTFLEVGESDTMPLPDMFKSLVTAYAKTLLTQQKSFDSEMIAMLETDVKRRVSSRTNKAIRLSWTT